MTRFTFSAVVLVAACVWPARADDDELKKTAKGAVEKMQAATVKGDYETLIDLTHPKVVEKMGGRDKAVATTKKIMKDLADEGFVIKSMAAGQPSAPVRAGRDTYILVPTTTENTTPTGKATVKSYVLGVSADGGKTWQFVAGGTGPAEIRKLFPDLPKTFDLPEVKTDKN